MSGALRTNCQFATIVALFAGVAWLSNWPVYSQIPKNSGVVMLSFVHSADRRDECRRLEPEEMAKLAPNMRRVQDCPRMRRPVYVELDVDGRNVYRADLAPTGVAGDGPSRVYQRFILGSGKYDLAVRMRDTDRKDGFDHERRETVSLSPAQLLVIDYRPESGEFIFQ